MARPTVLPDINLAALARTRISVKEPSSYFILVLTNLPTFKKKLAVSFGKRQRGNTARASTPVDTVGPAILRTPICGSHDTIQPTRMRF